jgi:hypothetical protein
MPFSIQFLDEPLRYPFDDANTPGAPGLLVMGESKEGFCSTLYQWSKQQYESQWERAIDVLLNESLKAALIVEYIGPDAGSHLEWWAMYREGETVYLQDQLLFYSQLSEPFSLDAPFESLRDRETINAEGQKISEWSVSLQEIKRFAGMIGG